MKSTKKALLLSALSLLLCCSMLIGTTFAWFTDEVTSGTNKIYAGNLDVDVVDNAGNSIQDRDELFSGILWEPGVVAYENLTVKNLGTLALKYAMYINFENQNYVVDANGKLTPYGLASALKVAVVDGAITETDRDKLVASVNAADWTSLENLVETGALYPTNNMPTNVVDAASEKTYGIIIYWQPGENDNNWNVHNGKTTTDGEPLHIDLGIKLTATQLMYEEDSFGNDYDEDAKFDILPQASVTDIFPAAWSTYLIKDIINDGIGSGTMVELTLDTAYSFKGEPVETAEQNEYADWFVDFYVSLDKAPAEGLVLSGQYGSWDQDNWYAFYVPTDMVNAGEFYPLLGTVTGGGVSNWTYTEICDGVGTFNCGAVDMKGLNEGTTMTVELRLINPDNTNETITVKRVEYKFGHKAYPVNNADELAQAVAEGYTDLWLNDGEYDVYGCAGKTLTISGTKNAVLKVMNEGEDGCDYGFGSGGAGVGNITFNGVTFDTTSNTGNYKGYAYMNATFNDCNFVGAYTSHWVQTYNNCHFDFKNGYFWIWGAEEVTFNECVFGGNSKAILAHGWAATKIIIKNCEFAATEKGYTGAGDNTAAVEIDAAGTNLYEIIFIGNNTVTDSYAGLYRVKSSDDGNHVIVVNP